MLSPSLRSGAFTGLEWSFEMRALGFDERGRLLGPESHAEEDPDEEAGVGEQNDFDTPIISADSTGSS